MSLLETFLFGVNLMLISAAGLACQRWATWKLRYTRLLKEHEQQCVNWHISGRDRD